LGRLGLLLQHFLEELAVVVSDVVGGGVQVASEGAAQVVFYCGVDGSRGEFAQAWESSGRVQNSVEAGGGEVGHQAGGLHDVSAGLAVVAGVCVHGEAASFLAAEVACVCTVCHVGVVAGAVVVALHVGGTEHCNCRVLPPHSLANLYLAELVFHRKNIVQIRDPLVEVYDNRNICSP
jgi:hypothetical protein